MKSEEREELQQNDLANWMYQVPFFLKTYGSYILLVAALLLLIPVLWSRHQDSKAAELTQAWASLNAAASSNFTDPPSEFRSILSRTDSRPLQAFAYAKLGTFYLDCINAGTPADGFQGVKISAAEAARQSQDAFNKVISDYSDQTMAMAEARLGSGALSEDLGQWDQAKKEYEAIVDKSSPLADSAFADIAQHRLDNLDTWSKPAPLVASPPEPASEPASQSATLPAMDMGPPARFPTLPALPPEEPATKPAAIPTH